MYKSRIFNLDTAFKKSYQMDFRTLRYAVCVPYYVFAHAILFKWPHFQIFNFHLISSQLLISPDTEFESVYIRVWHQPLSYR